MPPAQYEMWRADAASGQASFTGLKWPRLGFQAVSPDGKRIAYVAGTAGLREVWALEGISSVTNGANGAKARPARSK